MPGPEEVVVEVGAEDVTVVRVVGEEGMVDVGAGSEAVPGMHWEYPFVC